MQVKIIKKNDEYSPEYAVGDIFEVEGTWYGGVHITGKSGVPVSIDKDEYEEIEEVKDLPEAVYDEAASYWTKKKKQPRNFQERKFLQKQKNISLPIIPASLQQEVENLSAVHR